MKIIYYSQPFFADCDFPLIRELQRKGHDVRYYMTITSFNKRSSLVDIKNLYPHTGIYPASIYHELEIYKNDIDLKKLFIVNQRCKQKFHPLNILLYIRLAFHFWKQRADVVHFVVPPTLSMKTIYLLLRKKMVLTLHDPFTHSSRCNKRTEKDRLDAFKYIPKLMLLNKNQVNDFIDFYNVPKSHIFHSHLGMYDSITNVKSVSPQLKGPFILFFGLISAYKGIEFLMEAMLEVHKKHPNVNLVIAGGGKIYFDISPFQNLDYITIINHYIPTEQLAGLLKECMFAVCPYKDATQSGVVQTAFSLAVPMVVTDVGDLAHSVCDGETGLVVPPCDVDSLVKSMNRLIENPQLLANMRKNIEYNWKTKMSWGPIADKYIECYKASIS